MLAACASKAPPAKGPALEKLPPPEPPAPPTVVQRVPSKEMAAHFPFKDEEITTLAYSDLAFLTQPDAVSALSGGLAAVASELGGVDKACVDAIVGGAKELLIAGTAQRQWVVVLKVPGHKLESVCAPKTGESETIEGTTKAWRYPERGRSCATTADWLACGAPDLVKRSLAAQNEPTIPVGLNPNEIVTLDDRDSDKDMKVSVASLPDRLEARVELNFDTDERPRAIHELAAHASEGVAGFNTTFKTTDAEKKLVEQIANGVVASHRGTRANLRVDLAGTPAEQGARLGTFLSLLGKVAVRERNEMRQVFVERHLQSIAEQIVKNWDAKDAKLPFGDKRLVSMPPVPKEVPKGQPVTTAEADWKAWKTMPHLTTPSYWQFEIKAAPDGQTADLIARGDTNGDGKQSTFKLHIRVDKSSKQLMIEPKVDATDPDE